MILGALAISTARAAGGEHASKNEALERECMRYDLDYYKVLAAQGGDEFNGTGERRRWWDVAIVVAACGVFAWLAWNAVVPPLAMNLKWVAALAVLLGVSVVGCGLRLWRQTRFS